MTKISYTVNEETGAVENLDEKKFSYCVGFMFSPDMRRVLLLLKDRPVWQQGKLNGVGGKVEESESGDAAMVREFAEEVGIVTAPEDWNLRALMTDPRTNMEMYIFMATGDISQARTVETEVPAVVEVDNLPRNVVPNLHWLIPFLVQQKYVAEFCGTIVG